MTLEMGLDRSEISRRIIEIIAEHAGIRPAKILEDDRLVDDLRICGDDGYELIEAIDKEFKIDWSELDAGVIFRNEPAGLPIPPWGLKSTGPAGPRYNSVMYEQERRTVADLVDAAMSGKWRQRAPVLLPEEERNRLLIGSYLFYTALVGVVLVVVLALLNK